MNTHRPGISVILPTYNERENVIPLINDIHKHLTVSHEILVVDDNSKDGTIQEVQSYINNSKSKHTRIIVRTSNHGLTKSIQEGINESTGNVVVWMDADMSMPAKDIPRLLQQIHEGYDVSIGSRFLAGGKSKVLVKGSKDAPLPIVLSTVLNKTTAQIFHVPVTDFTSGFVAAKKEVFRSITLRGDYGEYFINFVVDAHRKGFSIKEIPYVCLPRLKGESKTGNSPLQLFFSYQTHRERDDEVCRSEDKYMIFSSIQGRVLMKGYWGGTACEDEQRRVCLHT